ncbi:M4 family metallopeptidase [Haliangium sp.]|uniref:M4 family metallopeptidase n=1 Tax=Haliangium sp. TaxID=2663208 RepID=UPI003D1368A5
MLCTALHRHSIFCIVPPHVLREISKNGSAQQRDAALHTLAADATQRALRVAVGRGRPGGGGSPPAPEGKKQRTVGNAGNIQTMPGEVARREGDGPTGDVAVDEAYDGLGATWDFFWDAYGRNSIDDEGMPLDATVHYGSRYNNAFWNGQRMVFGDGDGEIFQRFTIALDIIGHELAHGVTQDEAGLVYMFQAGALNESMSDVFGSLVKQKLLGQTADQGDWLIGAGLFTDKIQGAALRSMKEPGSAYDDSLLGKDPQPGHMDDYVDTWQDNGGVHINSGIPNRAFYLIATEIGGYAWDKAGRIWYETLRDARLRTNTKFQRFAELTVDVAGRLYGAGGSEQEAVRGGWSQVGIEVKNK